MPHLKNIGKGYLKKTFAFLNLAQQIPNYMLQTISDGVCAIGWGWGWNMNRE
jgi:hypothetical protein